MRVLGTTEMKCCQIVVDDMKLPCDVKEFHRRYTKLGNELLGNCDLLPGRLLLLIAFDFYFSIVVGYLFCP